MAEDASNRHSRLIPALADVEANVARGAVGVTRCVHDLYAGIEEFQHSTERTRPNRQLAFEHTKASCGHDHLAYPQVIHVDGANTFNLCPIHNAADVTEPPAVQGIDEVWSARVPVRN